MISPRLIGTWALCATLALAPPPLLATGLPELGDASQAMMSPAHSSKTRK
jgi:hypothetical protein